MQVALSHASAHVFERNSVAPERELLHAALVKGCGQVGSWLISKAESCAGIRISCAWAADYSTRQILQTELALIHTMDSGKNAMPALNKNYRAPSTLGVDQQRAVELILHSPDQFTGLRGLAGTGKTKTLRALHNGMATAGFTAVFCVPTASPPLRCVPAKTVSGVWPRRCKNCLGGFRVATGQPSHGHRAG